MARKVRSRLSSRRARGGPPHRAAVRRIVCCRTCRQSFVTTHGSNLCVPCRSPPATPKTLALASARPSNLDKRIPFSSLKPRTLHLEAEAEEAAEAAAEAAAEPAPRRSSKYFPEKRKAVKNPYLNYKPPPRARTPTPPAPTAFAPGFHL